MNEELMLRMLGDVNDYENVEDGIFEKQANAIIHIVNKCTHLITDVTKLLFKCDWFVQKIFDS